MCINIYSAPHIVLIGRNKDPGSVNRKLKVTQKINGVDEIKA